VIDSRQLLHFGRGPMYGRLILNPRLRHLARGAEPVWLDASARLGPPCVAAFAPFSTSASGLDPLGASGLGPYEKSCHSYLEAVREYSEALASRHCFIGYLAELRTRIGETFGAAQIVFSRASTALREFAVELGAGPDGSSDVGGGGMAVDAPAGAQGRPESPSRSEVLSWIQAQPTADTPTRRSLSRRSRSRSPTRR
jgi:hypothetical protein